MTKSIQIPWDKSIWFFDIDDTIINTNDASPKASMGIKKIFETKFGGDIANRVQENFNAIYYTMLAGHRIRNEDEWKDAPVEKKSYDELLTRINMCQRLIKNKYNLTKTWSREVFVKLAAEQAGVVLTPEIIYEAVDAYWNMISEESEVIDSTLKLIKEIKKRNRPVFLITSSDGRLNVLENFQFDYNPEYSERKKRDRIEKLRRKGIEFDALVIGDPEDKPSIGFFKKAIEIAGSYLKISKEEVMQNAIMVGDSYAGDLKTPKEILKFELVVLYQKSSLQKSKIIDERQINTNHLFDIVSFFY